MAIDDYMDANRGAGGITFGALNSTDLLIDKGTEPETGFETPGFFGGSVIGGGTAYDPGPGGGGGTGTDTSDTSGDLEVDVTYELDAEENTCGDVDTGSVDGALESDWTDSTNTHIVVCTNQELSDKLTKGEIGALSEFEAINSPGDYTESIVSMANFGPVSKSPIDGKDRRTHNVLVSLPAGSNYVSAHSFTCIDLMAANKKYGTDFSDQYKVLSHSHEVLIAGGETISRASVGKETISNIKMKDYNKLSQLSSSDISLGPASSEVIFSPIKEFAVSKNNDGTASFVFDLDVIAALKSSYFGSIFSRNITTGVRNDIIRESEIISMDIIRKRVDIIESSEQSSEECIASSSQRSASRLLTPATKSINDREEIGSIILGTISEMNMQSGNGIRTFTGKDNSVPEEGKFEYTVKLTLKDAVTTYLRRKLSSLGAEIKKSEIWLHEMSKEENMDLHRKTFSYVASRDVIRRYGNKNTPIEESLTVYSEIIGEIFGNFDSKSVIDITFPMVNSVTGSPASTRGVIDAMKYLQNKMNNLLKDSIQTGQLTSERTPGSFSGFGSPSKGILNFEVAFADNLLDMCGAPSTGYDYIPAPSDNSGIVILSAKEYEERIALELSSISDNKTIVTSGIIGDSNISASKMSSIANLSTTMSSYLTPTSINVGGDSTPISDNSFSPAPFVSADATKIVEELRARTLNYSHGDSVSMELLSHLGITCEIIDKKETSGGTFVVDSSDAGSIFSESDNFTSKNLEPDELFYEKAGTNPSALVASALSPLLIKGTENDVQGEMNLNRFDIEDSDCVIKDLSISEVSSLPIQLKSVFLSKSDNIKQNFLEDPSEALFDIKCNSIVKVEALTYKEDSNGNMQANWSLMTPFKIGQAEKKSLRCRIVNYSNSALSIGQKVDLNAPIFNDHFVMGGEKISKARTHKKNSGPQRMQKYLLGQNKMIRDKNRNMRDIITKRN